MAIKILFLCVANSARSQLAESVAKKILPEGFEVRSAGSSPSGYVHPTALAVLQENGFPTEGLHSKAIDSLPIDFMKDLNYVITLCAEEVCPVLSSPATKLHWTHPDPAKIENEAERKRAFAAIMESLADKLKQFKFAN